ncbi:hypothetical protein [Streptomyces sp. NPDC054874]
MTEAPEKFPDIQLGDGQTVVLKVTQQGPPLIQQGALQNVRSESLGAWMQKILYIAWPDFLPSLVIDLTAEVRSVKKRNKVYRNYTFTGALKHAIAPALEIVSVEVRKTMDDSVYSSLTLEISITEDGRQRKIAFQGVAEKNPSGWTAKTSWTSEDGISLSALASALTSA